MEEHQYNGNFNQRRQRPLCEVRMGSLNAGMVDGNAMEAVEMMKRRKMEVLCVQEMEWRGDRARKMAEGYKMLHEGGDGRGNGVGIIHRECGDQQGSGTS